MFPLYALNVLSSATLACFIKINNQDVSRTCTYKLYPSSKTNILSIKIQNVCSTTCEVNILFIRLLG